MAANHPPTRLPFHMTFEIGSQMRGRLCDALVHHPNHTEEATAIVYEQLECAYKHYEILSHTRSRFLARAIGYQALNDKAVLIVEKLSTSSTTFSEDMRIWKLNRNGTTAIGWTDGIKEKYIQVKEGLRDLHESLHESGFCHGNLADGVFYGSDGNIRLCNFATDVSKLSPAFYGSLKGDFQAFSDLMIKTAESAQLPPGQDKIPDEVDCFENLMYYWPNESPATESNVKRYILLLYHAPIFWSNTKKVVFLESMYRIMNWDPTLARNALAKVSYGSEWWKKITDGNLMARFEHRDSNGNQNSWYNHRLGPLVLGRNYVQHTEYSDHYISVLEETFPNLFSAPFIELASGKYLDKTITFTQENGVVIYKSVFDLILDDKAVYNWEVV